MKPAAAWQKVVLATLAAYPVVMIALATTNGPGVSADSVSYAAAATSFVDSGRLVDYDGTDLAVFPPGLSIVLGSLMTAGVSMSVAAVSVNVLATAVTIVATYLLARQVLISPGWSLIAAAAVSLLAATVRVGSFLWTEALFTALITGTLALITWAVRDRRADWWSVVLAGGLVALATTVRYVGVVAIPVVMVALAWAAREKRVVKTVAAGAIGSMGIVLVAARNISLGAPALGERYPGSVALEGAIAGVVRNWGEYLAPSRTTTLTIVVGSMVAVSILLGIWLVVVRGNAPGVVIALFVGAYWLAIVLGQVGTRLDVVTERFGAPALAPTAVLVLVAIRSGLGVAARQMAPLLGGSRELARLGLGVACGAIGVLVMGLSIVHAVDFVRSGNSDGIGLAAASASERALVRALEDLPAEVVIASNDPWQVWWARGGTVVDFPPSGAEWPSDRVEADTATLVAAVRADGRVIAILDEGARASTDPAELRRAGVVVRVLDAPDGVQVLELTDASRASP